jgi:hypothetical protein
MVGKYRNDNAVVFIDTLIGQCTRRGCRPLLGVTRYEQQQRGGT